MSNTIKFDILFPFTFCFIERVWGDGEKVIAEFLFLYFVFFKYYYYFFSCFLIRINDMYNVLFRLIIIEFSGLFQRWCSLVHLQLHVMHSKVTCMRGRHAQTLERDSGIFLWISADNSVLYFSPSESDAMMGDAFQESIHFMWGKRWRWSHSIPFPLPSHKSTF